MIAGIVGYLQKGRFPSDIYNNTSIASLINNGHTESVFLHDLLTERTTITNFIKSQSGCIGHSWVKGDGTKSYMVTYYTDKDAFDRCVQLYNLESSSSGYKYQREQFLEKFELECVEYGVVDVSADNLSFDQIETLVGQGMLTDWPAELSLR